MTRSEAKVAVVPRYLRPPPKQVLLLPTLAWSVLIGAGLLLAVELCARSGLVSAMDLVPVSQMVPRAFELLSLPGFLGADLGRTLIATSTSFAISALMGIAVAYLMWRSRWSRRALQPYLNVFYAIPTFALYPVLVVLFGTGIVPIIVLSTTFSMVAIISNAFIGFNSVPTVVDKLAKSLGMTPSRYFRTILLPAALPDILAGLKLGLSYAIIAVLATEFILSTQGLGHFISAAYNSFNTLDMYAGMFLVAVLALVANFGLTGLLARFDWRRR